jgi:hypothetical protein
MIIADIILAFILALFFAVIFNVAMRSRQRALPIAFIFILFFLFAWAGGLWIRPLGPPVFGVYWIPSLVATILIFLVLISFAQDETKKKGAASAEASGSNAAVTAAVGLTLWILFAGLIAVIVVAYLV